MNCDKTKVPIKKTKEEIKARLRDGSLKWEETAGFIVIEFLFPATAQEVITIEVPYAVMPQRKMSKGKLSEFVEHKRMGAARRAYWALKGICDVIDDKINIY